MLGHWMRVISQDISEQRTLLNSNQFGSQIETYFDEFPALTDTKIAIIGSGPFADLVRSELYQMSWSFRHLKVADVGNFANSEPEAVRPVLDDLHGADIIPIIIGGTAKSIVQQVISHKSLDRSHPLFVDERIAYGKVLQRSYLNSIIEAELSNLRSITVMGYQRHNSDPSMMLKQCDVNINTLRLGQIRSNAAAMEPYIRDCTSLSFSLNSMKKAEAPIKSGNNPSGLKSEEACQICRYAGINEQMRSFMIYDVDHDVNNCEQSATLMAQMIWYFIDGVNSRMKEFPATSQHMIEYIVTTTLVEAPLKFFKSQISGRWWMADPSNPESMENLLPCTYDEYLSACRDEIPSRLIKLLG
ncbi:MAG: hypothetical protein R3275_08125 [Saprospiraceae bacterium]|nr:hypothetical protein [Saprospiraceae bacterium]